MTNQSLPVTPAVQDVRVTNSPLPVSGSVTITNPSVPVTVQNPSVQVNNTTANPVPVAPQGTQDVIIVGGAIDTSPGIAGRGVEMNFGSVGGSSSRTLPVNFIASYFQVAASDDIGLTFNAVGTTDLVFEGGTSTVDGVRFFVDRINDGTVQLPLRLHLTSVQVRCLNIAAPCLSSFVFLGGL